MIDQNLINKRFGALLPSAEDCSKIVLQGTPALQQRPYRHIIIAGMGGSALAGALLRDYYYHHDINIVVHRNYGLPNLSKEELKLEILYPRMVNWITLLSLRIIHGLLKKIRIVF